MNRKNAMKAYEVRDGSGFSCGKLVVFAPSRGKAMRASIGTIEFPAEECAFTDLRAVRIPELDVAYRGKTFMDWDDGDDRLVMVRDAGYHCDEGVFFPDDCARCTGKDYCRLYESELE